MSRSKLKGQGHQGQKTAFSALSAACVRFVFGKTSLASSSFFPHLFFLTYNLQVRFTPVAYQSSQYLQAVPAYPENTSCCSTPTPE